MSDLIERVARKAGWIDDSPRTPDDWWARDPKTRIFMVADSELTSDGLVLLLKELLAAGWHFGKEGDRFIAATTASRTAGYVFHFGPTLEEAAMLAYLAMDDAHKGEP